MLEVLFSLPCMPVYGHVKSYLRIVNNILPTEHVAYKYAWVWLGYVRVYVCVRVCVYVHVSMYVCMNVCK